MRLFKFLMQTMTVACCLSFLSCTSNDDTPVVSGETVSSIDEQADAVSVEIISESELTAQQLADSVFGDSHRLAADPTLSEFRSNFLKKQKELSDKLAAGRANGIATGYRSFNFTYTSRTELGATIKLSARVYWGTFWPFGALDPDYIVLCPHFTIGSDAECPTKTHTYEAAAICGDNLLIMPDYKGFGETKGTVQPYVNHNLCAQNCIDALAAGYKIFKEKSGAKLEDDWKLYVVGASQGGGNALAVHKWLDTHPDFAKEWRFDYSYCCAGPYDPGLTFQQYFTQKKHTYPCVFPFTIKAMREAYPDILRKWTENDFYNEDYVKNHKEEMDRMVASKNCDCNAINAKFFGWYPHKGEKGINGGSEIFLSDILSPAVMDENSEMYKALMYCLEDNDLTKGWTPTHQIKLYHGRGDDIVPYSNAQAVAGSFPSKVTLFNSVGTDGHIMTCLKWLGTVLINNW